MGSTISTEQEAQTAPDTTAAEKAAVPSNQTPETPAFTTEELIAALAPAVITSIPEQKQFTRVFPLVLTLPTEGDPATLSNDLTAITSYLSSHSAALAKALASHGAIVFRGFPVNTLEEFEGAAKALGWEAYSHTGDPAPWTLPPDIPPIPLHHKVPQSGVFPGKLFFWYQNEPEDGADIPISLSNEVYEKLKQEFPELVEEIVQKGVKYVRILAPEGHGWQSIFQTSDKVELERKLQELDITWEWLPEDSIKVVSPVLKVTKEDTRTGKISWFNSISTALTGSKGANGSLEAVLLSDDSPFPTNVLHRSLAIAKELAVSLKWQRGDVVIVDNLVTMHGSASIGNKGPVQVSLWK